MAGAALISEHCNLNYMHFCANLWTVYNACSILFLYVLMQGSSESYKNPKHQKKLWSKLSFNFYHVGIVGCWPDTNSEVSSLLVCCSYAWTAGSCISHMHGWQSLNASLCVVKIMSITNEYCNFLNYFYIKFSLVYISGMWKLSHLTTCLTCNHFCKVLHTKSFKK